MPAPPLEELQTAIIRSVPSEISTSFCSYWRLTVLLTIYPNLWEAPNLTAVALTLALAL